MASAHLSQPRFAAGQTVMTAAVNELAQQGRLNLLAYLDRHLAGDWGDVCEDDRQANEDALVNGDRLFSVYRITSDLTLWIITEWDRSITTLLLPNDY